MMTAGRIGNIIHGLKPVLLMVVVQVALAGVNVFYKLASNDGMSVRVMVAYRFLFASAAVIPLALYLERNSRPKLTWMVIIQAFICALFGGSLAQNLYGQSLAMTSATFASATTNLIPAFTFTLAVFFRLERFDLKTRAGQAKVIGTLICMGGAMVLTFYKGFEIKLWSTHHYGNQNSNGNGNLAKTHHHNSRDHIVGPFLAIASCLSGALSLIFQAKMSKRYPCHYSSTALICLMGSVQAAVFALCFEQNHWEKWKLGFDIRLLAVAYSGIAGSGLMVVLTMWCVRMRGPLFVSVFSPLMLVLVAIAGSLFLDEQLHLGSVLGAFVIVCGLYSVLWGNSKEMKRITRLVPSFGKTDEQKELEMAMAENDRDAKNCNVIAIGIAPNFLPSPKLGASDDDEDEANGDKHLEEGIQMHK